VKPTDGVVVYVGGRLRFGMRFRRLGSRIVVSPGDSRGTCCHRTGDRLCRTGAAHQEAPPRAKAVAPRTFRQRCRLLAPFMSSLFVIVNARLA